MVGSANTGPTPQTARRDSVGEMNDDSTIADAEGRLPAGHRRRLADELILDLLSARRSARRR